MQSIGEKMGVTDWLSLFNVALVAAVVFFVTKGYAFWAYAFFIFLVAELFIKLMLVLVLAGSIKHLEKYIKKESQKKKKGPIEDIDDAGYY
jgi:predicted membrane protein